MGHGSYWGPVICLHLLKLKPSPGLKFTIAAVVFCLLSLKTPSRIMHRHLTWMLRQHNWSPVEPDKTSPGRNGVKVPIYRDFSSRITPMMTITPPSVKPYRCRACGNIQQIKTNHHMECADYCTSCSWKCAGFSPENTVILFGRAYRIFDFDPTKVSQ